MLPLSYPKNSTIILNLKRPAIYQINIQRTTSIAEKTVRPLMSATTVVSATAVVACSIKNV